MNLLIFTPHVHARAGGYVIGAGFSLYVFSVSYKNASYLCIYHLEYSKAPFAELNMLITALSVILLDVNPVIYRIAVCRIMIYFLSFIMIISDHFLFLYYFAFILNDFFFNMPLGKGGQLL